MAGKLWTDTSPSSRRGNQTSGYTASLLLLLLSTTNIIIARPLQGFWGTPNWSQMAAELRNVTPSVRAGQHCVCGDCIRLDHVSHFVTQATIATNRRKSSCQPQLSCKQATVMHGKQTSNRRAKQPTVTTRHASVQPSNRHDLLPSERSRELVIARTGQIFWDATAEHTLRATNLEERGRTIVQ